MLLLISSNPIFDKWLDGAALRTGIRINKISPPKSAADWFNLPKADQPNNEQHDEHDTASRTES